MSDSVPIIRDEPKDFSGDCCPKPGGLKEIHRIHRTLPTRVRSTATEDFLQDEAGFPILDEQTNQGIFDDLKNF
jgi:hypothetical protein